MTDRPQKRPLAVEFVCLGNICRSPLGEGIFRHLVTEAGLQDRFTIASAGTGSWHVGEPPYPGSIQVARAHGIDISRQRARHFGGSHFDTYDELLAMDASNLRTMSALRRPHQSARLGLMLDEAPGLGRRDVPDPFGEGPEAFQEVYELLLVACTALLERLRPRVE